MRIWFRLRCCVLQAVEVGQYLDDQGITLRIDPSDGKPYTKAQFVGLYRGTQEWDAAAPAPAPAPAAAPAPAPAVAAPAVGEGKGKAMSDGCGVEAEPRRQRTLRRRLRALEKSREKTERTIEREVNSSWLTCDQITALARSVFAFALCSWSNQAGLSSVCRRLHSSAHGGRRPWLPPSTSARPHSRPLYSRRTRRRRRC